MSASPHGRNTPPGHLRSYVDRLVRLEEERKQLASDIRDVKQEAASAGFDKKVVAQMVREAMMGESDRAARREFEEICEVYRANLGMLGGTPLGEAARRRAAKAAEPEEEDESAESEAGSTTDENDTAESSMPEEDVEAAREKGRQAGNNGEKIFANPYVSGDPRRAAWDEGWCEATGSDGMDVPDAWRRKSKSKKPGSDDEGAP